MNMSRLFRFGATALLSALLGSTLAQAAWERTRRKAAHWAWAGLLCGALLALPAFAPAAWLADADAGLQIALEAHPCRAQGVEEVDVVAAQLDVFEVAALAQGVVGEVEDVIGLVIGQMDFEQFEVLIDFFHQAQPFRRAGSRLDRLA